jgi:hypothetical protein
MSKKKPLDEDVVITRNVPFPLTDAEIALRAKAFTDGLVECEMEEDRIKNDSAARKKAVEIKRASLNVLREAVSTRKELRIVDCFKEPDLQSRAWRIRRKDTLEVVDLVPMSEEEVAKERQLDLAAFASLPKKTDEDEAGTAAASGA